MERHYPALERETHTLSRLWSRWPQLQNAAQPLQIGGRYLQQGADFYLFDAFARLKLPAAIAKAQNGDLMTIQVHPEDLKIDTQMHQGFVTRLEMARLSAPCHRGEPTVHLNYATAKKWDHFLQQIRGYFAQQKFLAVTTPTLVSNPGMEPELEPLATVVRYGSSVKKCFLPTSPELHLKQWLVAGFSDIYEIKTVFRNEEVTSLHQPEFTMLEWYRAFATSNEIEKDLCDLIETLNASKLFPVKIQHPEKISVAQLMQQILLVNLTPQTTREELIQWLRENSEVVDERATWNDLFHQLWAATIEPELPTQPLIIYNYPPSQAALSRITPEGWADRFEFFINRMEIANAFHELNDPGEQRERFVRDQILRTQYGRTPLEIDERFMRALEYGLPPSGGIALGVDRLFMVLIGMTDIGNTRPFKTDLP